MGGSQSSSSTIQTTTLPTTTFQHLDFTAPPSPISKYPEYHGPANITGNLYDKGSVPAQALICLNLTFHLIGNVSHIKIPYPALTKNVDVFNAHNNMTQCAEASTCGGYNILIIDTKKNQTTCERGMSQNKFEAKYGSKNIGGKLSYPNGEMLKSEIWMGWVNITDSQWDTVYPSGDPCHNGPKPKRHKIFNNPDIDGFCLRSRNPKPKNNRTDYREWEKYNDNFKKQHSKN